jgi:hypothetical protein
MERVNPESRSYQHAKAEMIEAMEHAALVADPPEWYRGPSANERRNLEGYLMIAPDVVFVVGRYPGDRQCGVPARVKTVLTRRAAAPDGTESP